VTALIASARESILRLAAFGLAIAGAALVPGPTRAAEAGAEEERHERRRASHATRVPRPRPAAERRLRPQAAASEVWCDSLTVLLSGIEDLDRHPAPLGRKLATVRQGRRPHAAAHHHPGIADLLRLTIACEAPAPRGPRGGLRLADKRNPAAARMTGRGERS
jgi:hypothetical protein